MIWFFLSGFFLLLCLIFFIVGIILRRNAGAFERGSRIGKAEVVGYTREERSSWYTLLVRLPELNDGKVYNCMAGTIRTADYPKGTTVDVIYATRRVLGMDTVEVHLMEKQPANQTAVATAFRTIAIFCLILAAAACIAKFIL